MWKGRRVYREVVELFGPSVLGERGGIDREKLGARVFGDRRARARLEAILHPAILRAAQRAAGRIARERFCPVVFEAPLLMESGFDALVHDSIVVVCDSHLQVERLERERGIDRAEARRRVGSGPSDAFFRRRDLVRTRFAMWTPHFRKVTNALADWPRVRRILQ